MAEGDGRRLASLLKPCADYNQILRIPVKNKRSLTYKPFEDAQRSGRPSLAPLYCESTLQISTNGSYLDNAGTKHDQHLQRFHLNILG